MASSLQEEYEQKYVAQRWRDDQEGVTLYGDTFSERLKTFNFAEWCDHAAICTRFCRLCGFPMDPPQDTHPDERCLICAAMEAALLRGDYWQNLPKGDYNQEKRSRMGLE